MKMRRASADEMGAVIKGRRGAGEADGEDPKRLTRWVYDGEREPSGHAGGARMRGGEWLAAEAAALKAKGRQVAVVRHATLKGHAALFLE